jgi:RimJ/RimL family protein N-acetyltransferase
MVGLRTTPTFKFLVSRATDDAAPPALADAIADHCAGAAPVGLLGPADVSERVALRLAECFGTGPPSAGMAERYLAAVATCDPPHGMPKGELRRADIDFAADGTLLAGWCEAFEADVGLEAAMRKPGAERVHDYGNDLWVWCAPQDDDAAPRPVAMAAVAGDSTLVGAQRISLVYTPPDCRRRGYASAVVHAVTAALLADGAQPYMGIVTDAANPTSNHVYESVGFEHVADGQNWWLK